MLAYIITGLAIIGYCCIQELRDGDISIEAFRDPVFWIVGIGVVVAWPILIASALYEAVKIVKD